MTREELEALATSHGVAETIQILEMVMLPRKQGSSQRERGARVQCLLHEGEPPFCRKTGDLAKSWRNGTSGCPTCAKITAGLNHRNDLEELRRFVAREAIGPSVEILALVYRKGMGHAHCRCLNCNHVFEQQIGWLKEKIPRGSNGCPECWRSRASTGEAMTKALLSPLAPQPYVIREHWIPANLWPSQTVMLDFLVENSVIIEIHGLQHFEFIPHFHNGDPANFVRQQLRDEWKRSVLPTKGYFFLEVDMRGVKSRADLACELRRQALNLAKRAPEKSGVHALLRIAAICEQSVVTTTGHSKSPG